MFSLSIPSFRKVKDSKYTVYEIRLIKPGGREVVLAKRFREFNDFHKQISKIVDAPHFPSRKLPRPLNSNLRFLESRREALELYLRNLMSLTGVSEVRDLLGHFLDTKNFDTPRTSSVEEITEEEEQLPRLTHMPVVCFTRDPFQEDHSPRRLPDIVLQGALDALYG